jgi:hypothetical protein
MEDIRRTEGCLKNSYHITALHNAGDCDDCFVLLARSFMKLFSIFSHEKFGSI